ncbi:MAG: hypothetical protein F6K11_10790 [Leptolyngbya sp. SIO3F4]|nr:hypothetical protein [Leptolyngbya sp. SIO3F4]
MPKAGWVSSTRANGQPTLEPLPGDENDLASGHGWCQLKDSDTLEGEIAFHMGDSSGFESIRAA